MNLKDSIFNIRTAKDFEELAFEIFRFQFENNSVYRSYCDLLYKNPSDIKQLKDIPFLPIQFFKSHSILSSNKPVIKTFSSSGTTGNISKHLITDLELYKHSFSEGFRNTYGKIEDYTILALLPSYLEREGSSLIYMVEELIQQSKNEVSGFYLYDTDKLVRTLIDLEQKQQKTILIGVSFALLDLIEDYKLNLKHTIIMETGGMKGRRKELVRDELHKLLKKGFGVDAIHSEYGMTELLSQAYSKGDGIFHCPKWMRVLTRDPEDPLTINTFNKSGGLNIIDLANINSCSFIATQDLGKVYNNGTFEVIGRFDNSDIRGCNLMVL